MTTYFNILLLAVVCFLFSFIGKTLRTAVRGGTTRQSLPDQDRHIHNTHTEHTHTHMYMYVYVGKVSALFASMNNVAEMNIDEWLNESRHREKIFVLCMRNKFIKFPLHPFCTPFPLPLQMHSKFTYTHRSSSTLNCCLCNPVSGKGIKFLAQCHVALIDDKSMII